eukprot:5833021-Prymnesium_polylepis.1
MCIRDRLGCARRRPQALPAEGHRQRAPRLHALAAAEGWWRDLRPQAEELQNEAEQEGGTAGAQHRAHGRGPAHEGRPGFRGEVCVGEDGRHEDLPRPPRGARKRPC